MSGIAEAHMPLRSPAAKARPRVPRGGRRRAATLTPADVQAKRFSETRHRRGYDEMEVDDFLDEVAAALGTLLEENERLRAQASGQVPQNEARAP